MKHRFLLDENIFYHAIKCVDGSNREDLTCTILVFQIARNCHRIIVNDFLRTRYRHHFELLKADKSRVLEPTYLLNQLVLNSLKVVNEYDEPPKLPSSCKVPAEDVDVVRAALISHPRLVTADDELRNAINGCEALHLRALTPADAIILASDF